MAAGGVRLVAALDELADAVIYDITLDARLAATATYSSAIAGALSAEDAALYFDDNDDDTNNEGGTPTPSPTGGGQDSGGGTPKPASLEETLPVRAVATEAVPARAASASAGA